MFLKRYIPLILIYLTNVQGFSFEQINTENQHYRQFYCYGNESILAQCQNQKVEICRSEQIVILKCGFEDQNTIIEELVR